MCRADVTPMTKTQRGRIMALCARIGLDQEERHDLAEYLLDRRSLASASQTDARRLIDALEGYISVCQLLTMRPPGADPGLPKPAGRPVYATDDAGNRWLVAHR